MVEFVLIAPLFLMLLMGMLDYGLVFRDYLTVANTTRTGARVGSAAGTDAAADYQILQAIKSASAALPVGTIAGIAVFKSNTTGTIDTTCKTTWKAGVCNFYTAADMALSQASLLASGKSAHWAPATREDRQSVGPDQIGVWVKVNHGMVTKMFGSTKTLTDKTVMRIEPRRT
jgi:hypothetical protein